jgi:hypothetical protein
MATDTKTEEVVRDMLRLIGEQLDAPTLAELKDMLMARHGIRHEVVSEDAYEDEPGRGGANDRLARDHARSFPSARSAIFEMQAIERARAECQAYIDPTVLAFDSEADVYATALREMGMDVKGTPPGNVQGIFRTMRGLHGRGTSEGLAMDSAASRSAQARFLKEFPGASIPRRA